MRLPSWYKVLENSREASLELAAALAESYAELQREDCDPADDADRCEDAEDREPCAERRSRSSAHCRDRGDFLSDWMRLNIEHMNQVAMLGSSYASLMARGLGALYSRGVHSRGASRRGANACEAERKPVPRCELEFCGYPGEYATARFWVRNDLREAAELELPQLKGGALHLKFRQVGGSAEEIVEIAVSKDTGDSVDVRELEPGERCWLVVRLPLGAFAPGRRYRAQLRLRLGGRSKPISLRVRALKP